MNGITSRIREALLLHPESSTKAICVYLKIDYNKYKGFIWKERSNLKSVLSSKVLGRPLEPQFHRVEFSFIIDGWIFARVQAEADRHGKGSGVWYRSKNRNRALVYHDRFCTLTVFPKSLSCRCLMGFPMPLDHFRVHVQNALFKSGLDIVDCERLSGEMEIASQSRTFLVGDVAPFKIDFYRNSLGLTLKADGSHPKHIEVDENAPSWIPYLIDNLIEYTTQINKHLDVLDKQSDALDGIKRINKSINRSINRLNEILERFNNHD